MFSQQKKYEALNMLQEETRQQSMENESNIQQENTMENNSKEMEAQNTLTQEGTIYQEDTDMESI